MSAAAPPGTACCRKRWGCCWVHGSASAFGCTSGSRAPYPTTGITLSSGSTVWTKDLCRLTLAGRLSSGVPTPNLQHPNSTYVHLWASSLHQRTSYAGCGELCSSPCCSSRQAPRVQLCQARATHQMASKRSSSSSPPALCTSGSDGTALAELGRPKVPCILLALPHVPRPKAPESGVSHTILPIHVLAATTAIGW